MRNFWPVAVGVVLGLVAGAASAQPPLPTDPAPAAPTTGIPLPPLLPPPPPSAPLAEVPRPGTTRPEIEYDPGYLYLPEREPERRPADECGPAGRWWLTPSLELAWVPRSTTPATVRLRLTDPMAPGGTVPGPVLPVAGRATERFDAALGLVLGRWFGEGRTNGAEASFFVRGSEQAFIGYAPGALVLFPQGTGRTPQVIPLPEPLTGRIVSTLPATLSTFYTTVDVNYRHRLYCDDHARLDALAGYRFAYLQDELYLGEYSDGSSDYKRNRVSVANPFHGGQIGLAGEYRGGNGWYVAGAAKVAFGVVTPEATASGLFIGAEGRTGTSLRTLRALNAASESEFAVMPTMNVSVGRQVTRRARVFGGYSFQYLSRVGRIGDALTPSADALALTDFWVQSINMGFELRY